MHCHRGRRPVQNAAADFRAAITVMQRARRAPTQLKPLSAPMTHAELMQRAQVIAAVIRAHQKLHLLRDRSMALRDALERFRARREAMQA